MYYVYILTNKTNRVLYVGVTGDLQKRVYEHKSKAAPGFTSRYNVCKLVYFECTENVAAAIEREKQLKGWVRQKKVALIESENPTLRDLYGDLF